MKALENKAEKYDKGIKTLTLGKLPKIKQYIVENYVEDNDELLDIGMGTGTFTILCAKKGAKVTGIDFSEKMLKVAKKHMEDEELNGAITIIKMPVVDLDKQFSENSFDKVTSILCFSELYQKEQDYALDQIARIMKDDGEFILVDEVKPKKILKKVLYFMIRIPIAFINFLKAHVSTKPLKNFEERLNDHNFQIEEEKLYLLDTLKLMRIKKQTSNKEE